jgi:hypothetical protein
MSQNKHMTKAQLEECKALLGPAPVLSTEHVAQFDTIFDRVTDCLDPRNMVELIYIRHFVCASWLVARYTRHGTVAIERRFQQYRETLANNARVRQQHRQSQISDKAGTMAGSPSDIARLVSLEEKFLETVNDVDEILSRAPAERDHNKALELSMEFQEQLNTLIISQTAIRNDALRQLEIFRAGLGQTVSAVTETIIEAEFEEIKDLPHGSGAPSISPPDNSVQLEATDDLAAPNPSQPAQ